MLPCQKIFEVKIDNITGDMIALVLEVKVGEEEERESKEQE